MTEIFLKRGSNLLVTNEVNKNGYKWLHTLYTPPEFINTNNLKEIITTINKLDIEYESIKDLVVSNLSSLYQENVELEGNKEGLIESVKIFISTLISKYDLSTINQEMIFKEIEKDIDLLYD